MDASDVATQLDLVNFGLIRVIEDRLLRDEKEKMRITAKLYKLNVHGDSCYHTRSYRRFLTRLYQPRQRFILQSARRNTPGGR